MRLLHRDGSLFDEQGTLRRRVARDRDVVCVPLDRGSRARFALVQQGRQTLRRLASSFMLSTRHQSRRRGREFAWLSHTKENRRMISMWWSVAALAAVKAQSEGTRHAGTSWQLENKVLELSFVVAPTPTSLVIPLRFVLVVAGKKGPPRKNPVALAGTEAWPEGGANLRRLVFC